MLVGLNNSISVFLCKLQGLHYLHNKECSRPIKSTVDHFSEIDAPSEETFAKHR